MENENENEIRNIRLYISEKIREIDGVLKQKNLPSETKVLFLKRKSDLVKSRNALVAKFKNEKRLLLDAQCRQTNSEISDEKILKTLTTFKQVPLSLSEIINIRVKRKKKK